jgi:guanyl-specific ribonuclease Sa
MQPAGTSQQNDATQSGNGAQQTSTLFTQPDAPADAQSTDNADNAAKKPKVKENGSYTDKERVALYIHTYGHLPNNYITKAEAQKLGWNSSTGNLRQVAPGKSIGGDKFGNYEGQLPKEKKRKYYECDIDYGGGKRNAKRIVFSNDGLVFYTEDHYKTFEKLY